MNKEKNIRGKRRRVIGRVVKSGKTLLDIARPLAYTLNELGTKVTGFYLYFKKIILISKLRLDWSGGAQKTRQGDLLENCCDNLRER